MKDCMIHINPEKKELLNEYSSRINRVMDFIEQNIDAVFTLDHLSKKAGFSKYHFNRIFHSMTGESLFSFIQRIRIEKAAGLLITNKTRTITEIAFDCGFASSAAFSRSFKNRFQMPATQWRKAKRDTLDLESGLVECSEIKNEPTIQPERINTKIHKEITVAYIRYTGSYKGDAELFKNLYKKLFTWAIPRDLVDPACAESYVVYHDSINITESDKLRVSVCVEVPEHTKVNGEFGKMKLTGGKYINARFRLGPADYAHAWSWIFRHYLPSSGYQPDDRFCFEFYPVQKAVNSTALMCTVNICVPVKPL